MLSRENHEKISKIEAKRDNFLATYLPGRLKLDPRLAQGLGALARGLRMPLRVLMWVRVVTRVALQAAMGAACVI